jgi:hypothetical protein
MLSLRVIVSSFLMVTSITTATPLKSLAAREDAGPQRRGVAYNDPSFVKYFDQYGSHVTW